MDLEFEMASPHEWTEDVDLVTLDLDHIWFHGTNESRKLSIMHNKLEKTIDQFLMNIKKLTDPNEEKCGMKIHSSLTQLTYQRRVFNELTNDATGILSQLHALYSMSANQQVSLNILAQGECIKEILTSWCEYLASCYKLATSQQDIKQKLIGSYREATIKARKSEKALRQMQRKTYAQLLRCSVRSYDEFKESMQMSISLFQLEPMKCEQVLKLDVKNSIVNCNKGCTKPMAVRDSQQTNSCINASLATSHGSTHSKKLTNGIQTNYCTQKSTNVLQSNVCATKRNKTYGRNKEIVCSQLKLAGTENLCKSASVECRKKVVTSLSGIANCKVEKSITRAGCFANDVRKRKRTEYISNESKTNNLTLSKKQKLDGAHVNNYAGTQKLCISTSTEFKGKVVTSLNGKRVYPIEKRKKHAECANGVKKRRRVEDISDESKVNNYTPCKRPKLDLSKVNNLTTTGITKICNLSLNMEDKKKQDHSLCRKQNMIANGQANVHNKMKCKRTASSDKPYKTQESKPSLIPENKPKLGCKLIECKLHYPIKQSKSKIPLPSHQLGSKNESNLAALMKKIGAHKNLSFQQKSRVYLKIPGLKEISTNVANSR